MTRTEIFWFLHGPQPNEGKALQKSEVITDCGDPGMLPTLPLPKPPGKLHLLFPATGFKPLGPWERNQGWADSCPRGEAPAFPQIHLSVTSRRLRVKSSICSLCKCCRLPGRCLRLCPLFSRAYEVFKNINKPTCIF